MVVPFEKQCATGGDLVVGIAAIVDDDVDAAAFLLPAVGGAEIAGALACADQFGVRVEARRKRTEPRCC